MVGIVNGDGVELAINMFNDSINNILVYNNKGYIMSEIRLKGASGLGDTIYAYPIVKYYAQRYDHVHYMTDYPELYKSIKNVTCYKHRKTNDMGDGTVDIRFTYCGMKYTPGTSQFQDSVLSARINEKLDLKIEWQIQNGRLTEDIKKRAENKKICILAEPYEPFGRLDCWGALLRIKPEVMQTIVNTFRDKVYFIATGNRFVLHHTKHVQHDLVEKTTVSDLMDLLSICDFGLSQIGNLLPMCEALGKKNFLVFAKAAMVSENKFIKAITPEKTVHYKELNCSITDDMSEEIILNKFRSFI